MRTAAVLSPLAMVLTWAVVLPTALTFAEPKPRGGKTEGDLPELPPVLAEVAASRRGHGEGKGVVAAMRNGQLGLRLSAEKPLTQAQWDAVVALEPRWLTFNDRSLCDADMDRLVAIDPEEIHLRIVPLTGDGARRFGDMKRLTRLFTHHMKQPTPEAREALANHPTLEEYRTAGAFCIDALKAPKLKSVEFAELALDIENIETLAKRSTITMLHLFAHNQISVDGPFLAKVAEIQSLETLRITKTVVPYEGGLEHLGRLPRLTKLDLTEVDVSADDLEKLRQALPKVTLRHTPMKADYRTTWEKLVAKRKHAQAAPPRTTPANIVVFLADDAGYGDFSLIGNTNVATPAIDSLARGGAILRQFHVQPFCSPTRAEFLTGRCYPRTGVHGVSGGQERMAADERTIAQVFRDGGYGTGCFGKWHNGMQWPFHPLARGFDTFYGFTEGHWGTYFDAPLQEDGRFVRGRGYITDDLAEHAITFLERQHASGRPFFCYVPFNTPHSPMSLPDADWDRVRNRPIDMRGTDGKKEDLSFTRAALGMVENLDHNVGRVLAALDALDARDDTIVVFFSDNGPNSGRWNAGLKGIKGSTDEGGTRSVCCIRYPRRIKPGTIVEQVAGAIDLLPTLAALAGVAVSPAKPLDGADLSQLLAETTADNGTTPFDSRWLVGHRGDRVSVRTTHHRLDADGRLYDMGKDAGQTTDIAAEAPAEAARLRQIAEDYRREVIGKSRPAGLERTPIGSPGAIMTELPAGEAVPRGGVTHSSKHTNCSFLTHWTSPDDAIEWRVNIMTPGQYDLELWCTTAKTDEGATVQLSCGNSLVSGTITPAWDPPLEDGEDRVPRGESLTKDFRPLRLGSMALAAGPATLRMAATKIPGAMVADVFRLVLTAATEPISLSKPNVVVILADDLGYGDVRCYNPDRGRIPTPHIDRLAAEGIRFTDGHSSAAGCTPSRYALLTGRYDVRNRMEGVGVFSGFGGPPLIPVHRMTIASLAKQRGYRTACVGKWHLGWNWPITATQRGLLGTQRRETMPAGYRTPAVTAEQQAAWKSIFSQPIGGGPTALGFDLFYGIDVPAWPPFCFIDNDRTIGIPSQLLPESDLREDLSIAACQGPAVADWNFVGVLPDMERRACAEISAAADSGKPFLLHIPLPSPHAPWAVSPEWRGKSGMGTYADWVMQTDAVVGTILDTIDKSGAAANTLVIFSSDNGFAGAGLAELTSHGHHPSGPLRGIKAQPYEGGHRVPFIVRWPAVVKAGSVCRQLVQQTDILATLADILGITLPADAGEDSFSFRPLLEGEDRPVRSTAINSSGQGAYALRQGDWKLIVDTAGKMKSRLQLYNLADDLGEKTDLSKQEPARAAEMEALLHSIVAAGRSTPGPEQPNDGKLTRFATAVHAPNAKPNVIMILMDDLGWKDLGCTGSTFHETANIDRLAARGVLFTRSYAATPICSPTRASLLTGLSPARIGITLPVGHEPVELLEARVQKRTYTKDEAKRAEEQPVRGGPEHQRALQVASATRLSTKFPSIAKVFKANGYRTAHFGKWHLGPEPYSPLDHGFDVDVPHVNSAGPPRPGHFGPWPDWLGEEGPQNKGRQVDDCLAEHAIAFIRESQGQPFYLNFWPYGVHIPFQAKPELVKHFESKADPAAGQRNPLYAAMIKHTDDAIGRIWQAVEDAGLADRTVVVFTSDNGAVTNKMSGGGKQYGLEGVPVTDNAPLRGQKGDVYEGGVRVPGFIVWPGVGVPRAESGVAFTTMDVLPTLAEICGLKDMPPVDGRSLAPAVAGKAMQDRPFFMHYPHYGNWAEGGYPAVTMVADGWKLIRFFFDGPKQTHRYELYHLAKDPGEATDLSRQEPGRVAEMDRQIDQFLLETHAVVPRANPEYRGADE